MKKKVNYSTKLSKQKVCITFCEMWLGDSVTKPDLHYIQRLSQDLKIGSPNFTRARQPARDQPNLRAQKNATEECNVYIHEYFL